MPQLLTTQLIWRNYFLYELAGIDMHVLLEFTAGWIMKILSTPNRTLKWALLRLAVIVLPFIFAITDEASAQNGPTGDTVNSQQEWAGFYIGLQGGWGNADFDHYFHTNGHYNTAVGQTLDYDDGGLLLGGHAGYNWQFDRFVLGIEGGVMKSWLDRENVVSPFLPATDRWKSEVRLIATVTQRLGVEIVDGFLTYVKGGLAVAWVRDFVFDGGDFIDDKTTRYGWTVGVGLEHLLHDGWVLGAEYNYYDFGSDNINDQNTTFAGVPGGGFTDHDFDVTVHAVLARLSKKF